MIINVMSIWIWKEIVKAYFRIVYYPIIHPGRLRNTYDLSQEPVNQPHSKWIPPGNRSRALLL